MVIGAFGIFYTVWVYLTWLPSYLQTSRGFSLTKTGWLGALPFLCGIVGVLTGGFLSGRRSSAGHRPLTARKIPIVGGAVLAAAAVLPVAFVESTALASRCCASGYFAAQIPIGVSGRSRPTSPSRTRSRRSARSRTSAVSSAPRWHPSSPASSSTRPTATTAWSSSSAAHCCWCGAYCLRQGPPVCFG